MDCIYGNRIQNNALKIFNLLKLFNMRNKIIISSLFLLLLTVFFYNAQTESCSSGSKDKSCCIKQDATKAIKTKTSKTYPSAKSCVFKSIFNEESNEGYLNFNTPENINFAIDRGLKWVIKAQHSNGGWGAGLNSRQQIRDPHAVKTDPATSSMIGLALLRCGNRLNSGEYSNSLKQLTDYIIKEIDANKSRAYITQNRSTQIQVKLGQNIDAVISLQFLSNLLDKTDKNHPKYKSIEKAMNICVEKVQNAQDDSGRTSGGSWAGVLQSSMSTAALESAENVGAAVDNKKLNKARKYQQDNYDASTGKANTDDGAGIMLYSMSSSVRGAAKEARKIKEEVEAAKRKGLIEEESEISTRTLEQLGYSKDQSQKLTTAYKVYKSARDNAQRSDVMNGFGNNGGEEFISFLQTGESMIINDDNSWKNWYKNISGKMVSIQNQDGSWNGHHCITSPSFCTATCLLILSINNDKDMLLDIGR